MYVTEIERFLSENHIVYERQGENVDILTYCPLNFPKKNGITWCRHVESVDITKLNETEGIVLLAEYGETITGNVFPVLYVRNVHRTYFKMIETFFGKDNPDVVNSHIEKTAVIESVSVPESTFVGHFSYVGPDVKLGENVKIRHHVTIQGKVTIGDNTVIESGARIGVCGYGPYWDETGIPNIVPHVGGVNIGKHVYIGANACIARGCLGNTVIEDYVKIDNLVHIAHNDIIKRGAMVVAGGIVCGSTTVSEGAWIAPGAVVNESLSVGKNSILGIGAIVVKDVPAHKVLVGNPARVLREVRDGEL